MAVYESMKDSGIEWVGKIPTTWKTHTLYQLVTQVKNKNTDLSEQNLLSLSYGKIKRKDINSNGGLLPESFNGYNIIEDGDIVLRLTDLQNDHTSLRVGRATERGIITSAYTTLRPISKDSSKYLYYLLHAFDIKKGFYGMGSGVRQGLNYDEVKELRVIMPSSIAEQSAIASYLDDQCAKIDALIAEAKASIEEYKQWKASLIFEAVTKGLDPNVEMKDSRVEWIGKIPSSWSMHRIRINYSIISGNGFSPALQGVTEGDLPVCKASDISIAGKVITSAANFISYETANANRFNIVPAGSIIFAKIGEAMKKNNRAICGVPCCIDNNCQALVPEEIDSSYSYYLLRCIDMAWFDNAGTIPCISNSKLKDCHIPFPTIHEQEEIAEFLDCKCSEIDSLVREKQELIIDFEQYKHSLIYETVTGKRKVV
ncbi:MAG: restriction endonuclease subunit S [Ruminococcus sp.]|nr:restriction endonuclease subunit S [Ruminococcus sp.]